jgi:hypothetical protein
MDPGHTYNVQCYKTCFLRYLHVGVTTLELLTLPCISNLTLSFSELWWEVAQNLDHPALQHITGREKRLPETWNTN